MSKSCRTVSRARLAILFLWMTPFAASAGPWRAGPQNSAGWAYMTPDERVEHQRRLRGFTDYAECKAYQAGHHARMAERAARQGVTLTGPSEDHGPCEALRERGKVR